VSGIRTESWRGKLKHVLQFFEQFQFAHKQFVGKQFKFKQSIKLAHQ